MPLHLARTDSEQTEQIQTLRLTLGDKLQRLAGLAIDHPDAWTDLKAVESMVDIILTNNWPEALRP